MTGSGRTDSGDHYFTASPASPDERRALDVTLAGRELTVEVAPGIFSPGGVDKGTAVLFDKVPDPPPSGRFLDLGCGWGPIALTMGLLAEHAEGWTVARMPAVDRNLLRIGVFEMLWVDEIDDPVAITEAVELARSLSTDDSPRFLNGVLGRIADLAVYLRAGR